MNYLLGMHGANGGKMTELLDKLRARNIGAPLVYTFAMQSGEDSYDASHVPEDGFVITRLNYSYGNGTIPDPPYDDFVTWIENFVYYSKNVRAIIIGNEWNHNQEQSPNGITPAKYADCYAAAHKAAKRTNPNIQVLFAGTAPWNAYLGDWIDVMREAIIRVLALGVRPDGYAIHTYTHGASPLLIQDETMMDPPYEDRHYNFRTYRDYMEMLADVDPDADVYITETDQNDPWLDEANGWVSVATHEIETWNEENPLHLIRALVLFRWPTIDQWFIEGKENLIEEIAFILDDPPTWKETKVELLNEDFSGVFIEYNGITQLKVVEGAFPWWREDPDDPSSIRPEWGKNTDYFQSEPASQKVHQNFAIWNGGIGWSFSITPGSDITFSISGMIQTGKQDGPALGDGWWRIGIASGLHSEPPAETVWSEKIEYEYETWNELTLSKVVNSDYVTVFTEADWKYPVDWNDLFLDDAVVTSNEAPAPPPTGDYTVVIYDSQGTEVLRASFPGGTVNPQVNELARQIVSLTS